MNLKCLFGFHQWKDTGMMRMYGFVHLMECSCCKKQQEMTDKAISFGNVGGQGVMVIRR